MRILVYGLSGLRGGVESFIENYCLAMNDIDSSIEFEFIVIDKIPDHAKRLQERGFTFHVVPNRIPNLRENRQALREIIAKGEYDCLWYNACTLSDITAIEEARGHIPVIALHAHNSQNMGNAVNHLLHVLHKRKAAFLSNALLSCSLEASRFMFPHDTINQQRHHIVINGVDLDSFQFSSQSRMEARKENGWEKSIIYIALGRLSKQKNPLFSLDVFHAICDKQSDARLVFVGDGDMRAEIEHRIEKLGLADSVDILGARRDISRLLSAADILLLPSLFEGFPVALVEAQASGLPCVVSDTISPSAFLTDCIYPHSLTDDPEQWADSALSLKLRTPDQRLESASTLVAKGLDIHDCAKKMIALFGEMAETSSISKKVNY